MNSNMAKPEKFAISTYNPFKVGFSCCRCLFFKIKKKKKKKIKIVSFVFLKITQISISLWRFVLLINMLALKHHFYEWFKSIFKIICTF